MKSIAVLVLVAVAFIAAPFIQTNTYWQHIFGVAIIGAILALGLQLLVGMAGLLSLGQAAFYGIGAYVSAALTLHFGVPFPIAIAQMCIAVVPPAFATTGSVTDCTVLLGSSGTDAK